MSPIFIIICVLIAIASFALMALILLQKKQAAGFTSSMGGMMSSGKTYWDKNKKNSIEGKLEFYTKIVAVIYAVLILVSNFVH